MNATKPCPAPALRFTQGIPWLVLLVTLTARWWLVKAWGSPLPFWDQWDAEALQYYRPWIEGSLRWSTLLEPHNEHRMALTHLENLGLLDLNGRWDPLIQLAVNALWPALAAAGLARLALRINGLQSRIFVAMVAIAFAAPYGWQNTLWGFQSAPLLVLLFAVILVGGLGLADRWTPAWWSGVAALLLLPVTSGINLTVVAGTAGALLFLAATSRRSWRESAPELAVIAAGLLLALCARAPVSRHDPLRAADAAIFLRALGAALAWPMIDQPWTALVMYLPLGWLAWRIGRDRSGDQPALRLSCLLGSIAVVDAAGIAYARSGGLLNGMPLSRYQDLLALGALANLLALLALCPPEKGSARRQRWLAVTLIWTAYAVVGLTRLSYQNLAVNLPYKANTDRVQFENLTHYVATRDPAVLAGKALLEIGHSNAANLRAVLDDPRLQPWLPAALQPRVPPLNGLERFVRMLLTLSPWLCSLSILALTLVLLRPGHAKPAALAGGRGALPA
jgi:hypothetical protein